MPSRFSIGWSTVVMLVLLRVVIGWHFFSEGLAKFAKPFSSEGFHGATNNGDIGFGNAFRQAPSP